MKKQELFNHFFWLKWKIRKNIKTYKKIDDQRLECIGAIEIIKARKNPFDAARLKKYSEEKASLQGVYNAFDDVFRDFNPELIQLCNLADKHLNEHDQAQVLGLNHIAFGKWRKTFRETLVEVRGEDRQPKLYECIIHHAEYKGREVDFIGPDIMLTMPFYLVYYKEFTHLIFNDENFGRAMTGGFDKFFLDGSVTTERLPPYLKLVKNTP